MSDGPVVIAYDGSASASWRSRRPANCCSPDREALVLCAWQPFDVGFMPYGDEPCNAEDAVQVRAAAKEPPTTARSWRAARASSPKRRTRSAPIWKGIVEVAEERDAGAIVIGSHGHGRLAGMLVGSVAASVTAHSTRTVIIAHPRD